VGADVSTLGELKVALRAGIGGGKIVVHGNNKSDEELRAAAEADVLYLVLDAPDEVERAAAAGIKRALVRVTPGIEVDTHEAIQTASLGSKFGLTPEQTIEAVRLGTSLGLEMAGLHIHLGSQLLDLAAPRMLLDWLAGFVAVCRTELAWAPAVVDVGGGLGIRYTEDEPAPSIAEWIGDLEARLARDFAAHGLPRPGLILEPGRSLVARRASRSTRSASSRSPPRAHLGGGRRRLLRQPAPTLLRRPLRGAARQSRRRPERPFLHGLRQALRGRRRAGQARRSSGATSRRPAAVPDTGAYTLSMASNYNVLTRPAAVLVADGKARLIRRRETLEEILDLETL